MSDKSLIEAVRAELQRLGQGEAIHASADAGIVTLSGQVRDKTLKRVIAQEILRLPRVSEVQNELTVPPPIGDIREQLRRLLAEEGVAADEAPNPRPPSARPEASQLERLKTADRTTSRTMVRLIVRLSGLLGVPRDEVQLRRSMPRPQAAALSGRSLSSRPARPIRRASPPPPG